MKNILIIACFCFGLSISAFAQEFSLEEATRRMISKSPEAQRAQLAVQQQQKELPSAWNLPNPVIQLESPTALFYSVGVEQSFDFPTIYFQQRKIAKTEVGLAQLAALKTIQQLKWDFGKEYLAWQYAAALREEWLVQDSLWRIMLENAQRLQVGGQLSKLEYLLLQKEASKAQLQLKRVEAQWLSKGQLIQFYTGESALSLKPSPLQLPDSLVLPTLSNSSIWVDYLRQNEKLRQQELQLAGQKTLPSFYIGYLNQGPKNSDLATRFRAGIAVPLWLGQYRGQQQSAKIELAIAEKQTAHQEQLLQGRFLELSTMLSGLRQLILDYREQLLPQNESIIDLMKRLKEGGELDYANYIRLLTEAFQLRIDYKELLLEYHQIQLEILFLNNQL